MCSFLLPAIKVSKVSKGLHYSFLKQKTVAAHYDVKFLQHVSTQLKGHHQASTAMKLKMAVHKQLVYLIEALVVETDVGIADYDFHFHILICIDGSSLTCIEFKFKDGHPVVCV
jgi:hypothetical protein